MSTAAQVTANLANAQHSTGPRTETGKAASSQNALKHGLTAKTVLLPGEDEAAYRKMCEGMFESFAPADDPGEGTRPAPLRHPMASPALRAHRSRHPLGRRRRTSKPSTS